MAASTAKLTSKLHQEIEQTLVEYHPIYSKSDQADVTATELRRIIAAQQATAEP